MTNYKAMLELIQHVNNTYQHISQLESLLCLLGHSAKNPWLSQDEIDRLYRVCSTTINSHYEYKYLTSPSYQDPYYHVDRELVRFMKRIMKLES